MKGEQIMQMLYTQEELRDNFANNNVINATSEDGYACGMYMAMASVVLHPAWYSGVNEQAGTARKLEIMRRFDCFDKETLLYFAKNLIDLPTEFYRDSLFGSFNYTLYPKTSTRPNFATPQTPNLEKLPPIDMRYALWVTLLDLHFDDDTVEQFYRFCRHNELNWKIVRSILLHVPEVVVNLSDDQLRDLPFPGDRLVSLLHDTMVKYNTKDLVIPKNVLGFIHRAHVANKLSGKRKMSSTSKQQFKYLERNSV